MGNTLIIWIFDDEREHLPMRIGPDHHPARPKAPSTSQAVRSVRKELGLVRERVIGIIQNQTVSGEFIQRGGVPVQVDDERRH